MAGTHGAPRPRRDIGGCEVLGLHPHQRFDVAGVAGVELGGVFGLDQLVPDRTREVGISRLPADEAVGVGCRRIQEDSLAQFSRRLVAGPAKQLGDMVHIGMANFGQRHGQGIGGGDDHRLGRRMDHPLSKNRAFPGRSGIQIVILDRGDQPAIRVIGKGGQVRPALRLGDRAGRGIGAVAGVRQVDRPEGAYEAAIGHAEPHLRRAPGLVVDLSPQHVPQGIAHRNHLSDDPHVLGEDPLRALARLDRDGLSDAVDDLHQGVVDDDVASLLDRRALSGGPDPDKGRGSGRNGRGLY